jgi:hypothetical protein
LFADLTRRIASDPLDARDEFGQSRNRQRALIVTLLAILDFIFGCHHSHLSRVFTLQGETYKVCCDCAARFAYSLEGMSIERRMPLTS